MTAHEANETPQARDESQVGNADEGPFWLGDGLVDVDALLVGRVPLPREPSDELATAIFRATGIEL